MRVFRGADPTTSMSSALRLAAARLPAIARPTGARAFCPGYATPNNLKQTRLVCDPAGRGHLHGAENPTYLKKSGDKMSFAVGMALCAGTHGLLDGGAMFASLR